MKLRAAKDRDGTNGKGHKTKKTPLLVSSLKYIKYLHRKRERACERDGSFTPLSDSLRTDATSFGFSENQCRLMD
jgi:hypothetical protein